jgi:hypothetical protein
VRTATAGGGWGDVFEARPREDYSGWITRITWFLQARVSEVVSSRHRHQQELSA